MAVGRHRLARDSGTGSDRIDEELIEARRAVALSEAKLQAAELRDKEVVAIHWSMTTLGRRNHFRQLIIHSLDSALYDGLRRSRRIV